MWKVLTLFGNVTYFTDPVHCLSIIHVVWVKHSKSSEFIFIQTSHRCSFCMQEKREEGGASKKKAANGVRVRLKRHIQEDG